ncbi:MAG: type II secretion system F family protein [Phycisphaerae bacterium]|nr:type II secretion system F family protein [Phycisphaerae bacterium]
MPKYLVQFASPSGKTGSEVVEAKTERAALVQIEASGRTPISVQPAGAGSARKKRGGGAKRVRRARGGKAMRRAVTDFTHQMAAVAESGIPIVAGIKAIREQTAHPQLRVALGRIAGRIEGGRTLADALDAEPDIFPTIYVKTVAAGEAAGKVPEVLSALARYQEQEAETRAQIKSAMLYPMLVVGALALATVFMLVFVVPQFAKMFEKFEGQLPVPTRILLAVSGVITHHYLLVGVGIVASIFTIRTLLGYQSVRSWLDTHFLKMPVFGDLLLGVYMVRFIELLDLLTRAALPITQSINVTADSMTNEAIRRDVRGMLRSVEGGHSLTEAFAETRWLTPLVKRMLAIGEQAGRTDQIFEYLRTYYSRQTQRSVKLLSTLIEPVMVSSLAAVVLFFALAIFLPMWKLLKLVGTS